MCNASIKLSTALQASTVPNDCGCTLVECGCWHSFHCVQTSVSRPYSAVIGIMNFSSPLDSVACCLMPLAGRLISQRILPAFSYSSARRDLKITALKPTHNALHTQAWSPSPCSHTIPRDCAIEYILNRPLSDTHEIGACSITERNYGHNFLYWPSASSKHFRASCFSSTSSSPAKQPRMMNTWLNVLTLCKQDTNSHHAPAIVSLLHATHMRQSYGVVEQRDMLLCVSLYMVTTSWYRG